MTSPVQNLPRGRFRRRRLTGDRPTGHLNRIPAEEKNNKIGVNSLSIKMLLRFPMEDRNCLPWDCGPSVKSGAIPCQGKARCFSVQGGHVWPARRWLGGGPSTHTPYPPYLTSHLTLPLTHYPPYLTSHLTSKVMNQNVSEIHN